MGVLMESSQANQHRGDVRCLPAEDRYATKINDHQRYPFASNRRQDSKSLESKRNNFEYDGFGCGLPYSNGFSPIKEAGLDYSVNFVRQAKDLEGVEAPRPILRQFPTSPKREVLDLELNPKNERNLNKPDWDYTEGLQPRDLCNGLADDKETSRSGVRRAGSPTSMPPPKKKWMKNYMEEEPCGVLVQQIHNHQTLQHSHIQQQQPVTPVLRNGLTALSVSTANHINVHSAAVINPQHSLSSSLVNSNNVVSGSRAPPPSAPISIPPPHHAAPSPAPLHLLDHHDQPRARSNSNGSGGRSAGTREVHNKLEKNRRAHLKECFELLKKHLPQSTEEKKSSNLSILDNAIKYIQVLKRREKDCEHELEKLARQKIASQQRLASLRSGTSPITPTLHLHSNHDRDAMSEGDEPMMASRRSPLLMTSPRSTSSLSMSLPEHSSNGVLPSSPPSSLDLSTRQLRPPHHSIQPLQVLTNQQATTTMYIEQTSSPPHTRLQQQPSSNSIITTQQILSSPFQQSPHIVNSIVATPGTLNLTVNPSIKATRGPAKAVVAPGLPTLTVTTVNHGPVMAVNPTNVQTRQPVQNVDRKILTTVASPVNGQTAIVHPAQLHLPISQVVNGSGLVMSPTIQMIYATPQTLRMLQGQGGTVAPVDLPNSAANNSVVHQLREVQKVGESGMSAVPLSSSGLINGRTTQHHATNNGNHHHSPQPQHITVKTEGAKGTLHTINPQTQIMMNGLTPLLMSKGGTHIITAPQHLAGKMVSTPILKAVNAQYLGAAGGVKPVVVVSTGNGLQTQQIVPSSTTVPSPSSNS